MRKLKITSIKKQKSKNNILFCQKRHLGFFSPRSLGWEDPMEEGMATHSSMLAWRVLMDRGAWEASVHGLAELDTMQLLSTAQHTVSIVKNLHSNPS